MKNIIVAMLLFLSVGFAQQRTVQALYDLIADHPDMSEMSCESFGNLKEGTTCHFVRPSTFDAYLIVQEARDTFNLLTFRSQGWSSQVINEDYKMHTNAYFDENDYLSISFFQFEVDSAIVLLEIGTLAED